MLNTETKGNKMQSAGLIILFALLFLLLRSLPASEPGGHKYFKNYTPSDYSLQSQNWSILEDQQGIIYVANHEGIAEYDGVSWRVIAVPNQIVRALASDKKGTIYVGGVNQVGCLVPDEQGSLKYRSLLNHIPQNQREFGHVWKAQSTGDIIYFKASKHLFYWHVDTGEMRVMNTKNLFGRSFIINGELFIIEKDTGLMHIKGDALTLAPGGRIFAKEKVTMMTPFDDRRILVGMLAKGIFLFDGSILKPFANDANEYLKKNLIYSGRALSQSPGEFAIATRRGGLVIIDKNGRIMYMLNKTRGLQDDNVKSITEDSRGQLWLALESGISRLEYSSPFLTYDHRNNLTGLVLSVIKHGPKNRLYAGTTSGLFILEEDGKFRQLQPFIGMLGWSFLSTHDALLAATSAGIFQVDSTTPRKITDSISSLLIPSGKDKNRVWVGTTGGLSSLYLGPGPANPRQWNEEYRFKTITNEILTIVETKGGTLWLGTLTKGVIHIEFPDQEHRDIRRHKVNRYHTGHGLPPGENHVFMACGHIVVCTEKGLFRFDKNSGQFIPDTTFGDQWSDGSRSVFRVVEDKHKNIWIHSAGMNFRFIRNGDALTPGHLPFMRIPKGQVNAIYPDPVDDGAWFAGHNGLVYFNDRLKTDYSRPYDLLIRKVTVNSTTVFGGYASKNQDNAPVVIEYKDRNIRFEFAAPFFEAESRTMYSYYLEGYDDDWCDWTDETKKDYTNLDAGRHIFRVKAKNVYDVISREDSFNIRVLPPWYQAWWAYLFYTGVAFLGIYFFIKWRHWKLVREKKRLEQEVKERTKEVYDQNILLEEQSEKLKEMDEIKSRFFANISHEFRTPLTLIMGPLEQRLSESGDKGQVEETQMMLRSSRRLLALINQLLDLSKLESGRMLLQAAQQDVIPYLKGLVYSFESLVAQKGVELAFQTEQETIALFFDAEKMEKVVVNLVTNAIKFTPAGGKVTVVVKRFSASGGKGGSFEKSPPKQGRTQGVHPNFAPSFVRNSPHKTFDNSRKNNFFEGYLEIKVCDTGKGIPEDQLPYIFDRFYQAGSAAGRDRRGTGIGLALVKELVELHHGEVSVQSAEGEGSEFTVRLPLGKDHLKPEEITEAPRHAFGEPTTWAGDEAPSPAPRTEGPLAAGGKEDETPVEDEKEISAAEMGKEGQDKDVILIVEDNADVRKFIRGPLAPLYNVVEAADGREGIEKAKKVIPDLIISDIMMPEVDGYELCDVLKKDVKTSHIPIIMLTAKASDQSVIQGLETGADDYITKPFNTQILLTRIKNLIDLRRGLQEKIQRDLVLQPTEISVSSVDQEFMKDLKKAIEKNMSDEEFGVDELAKALYMARATLNRKIRAITGESTNQFIQSYRLKRAAQLLKAKFGNVTEVSFEVGFSSSAYFTKCFREKFHQPPHTYLETQAES